jgi:hypothetical protein
MADKLTKNQAINQANERLTNILKATAGREPANEDERWIGLTTLQDMFGVDFDEALNHYIAYKNANPIRRKLTDAVVNTVVGLNKNNYIKQMSDRVNSFTNVSPELTNDTSPYQYRIILGLKNIISQPSMINQIAGSIMDYRDLGKPLPFVQSKISYPPAGQ